MIEHLPDTLYVLLDGTELEKKQHEAFVLQSVTEEGRPHAAMISAGEIIAVSRTDIRIALWKNTTTARNLLRSGQALFTAWQNGAAYYATLQCEPLPAQEEAKYDRERFSCRVVFVKEDRAKYADLTSGPAIQLHEPENVLERWKETLEELKQ
ncbi:pyridoxamine 5'-phosphate oxidase family protein [Bacillus sp. ISL-26]|uniref:pyridoxamine 5'-phosphate oxidase family protein n=1 Tax=Bacillus sp. ISL-26 TaxID=2819119 RepID=UPI001BEB4BA8|nr:pyridoxamine 5'-phosphate oxidase family protein [Bacillus sp. ISL-26]MBT2635158.1 pyridoxamine 5'-phosphate oxidase family protein [Bacillus sp. ISL-26]